MLVNICGLKNWNINSVNTQAKTSGFRRPQMSVGITANSFVLHILIQFLITIFNVDYAPVVIIIIDSTAGTIQQ